MQQSEALDGAWFIHPEYDVIKTLAEFVGEIADSRGIAHDRVVFYGSSLGGFGAIGAAAHLPGSKAVAENPQIDFQNWMRSPGNLIEKHITRMPLEDYAKIHPEQLHLVDRLKTAGRIPKFRIVTNPTENSLYDQLAFYGWARMSGLPTDGVLELFCTTDSFYHQQLPADKIVPHVQV